VFLKRQAEVERKKKEEMKYRYTAWFLFVTGWAVLALGATPLRVGISQNPPLKFTDSTGEHTGLFVELIKEISREEGWTLTWHPGTFQQCMEWLQQGEIDVIPNIGYSYERSLLYRFCEENVVSTWAEVFCRPELSINSITELQGLSIAVQNKDVFINDPRDGFRYLISQFGLKCELCEVETYDDVLRLVESRQVDAGIVNRLVGDVNASAFRVKKTGVVFCPLGLRFAFSKIKPETRHMAATVDRYVSNWKDDPSSPYFKMMDRFYPVENPRTLRGKALIRAFCRLYLPWIIAVVFALGLVIMMAVWNTILNWRLDKQNKLLKKQVEEIRTLQGLIPICFMCGKVKDDKGYWESVEMYVSKRSGAMFTHGICPACLEKHYPEK